MKVFGWLVRTGREKPERLLTLLIRAHQIDALEGSLIAAYRAGIRMGAEHPELVANLDATEYPAPVVRRRGIRFPSA